MQTVFTENKYSDINIVNPSNGTNDFNQLIQSNYFTIDSYINDDTFGNSSGDNKYDYGTIYTNSNIEIDNAIVIYKVKLKIEKSFSNNIHYYQIYESFSENDPACLIVANQLSNTDIIEITWYNYNKQYNYNKLRIALHAFDKDGNSIFGQKVTGDICVYGL